VLDLHRWSRALDAHKLLSPDAYRKMFTPAKGNYAYGWFIDQQFGRQRIHHGGGINGFTTQLVRYPDDQVCVVVLSNTESRFAGEVARDLAALYFGETYAIPEERQFIQLDENTLDNYVGAYELAPAVLLTVTRDGARLLGQVTGQPRFELRPQSPEKFFVKEAGVEIVFVKGDDGQPAELLLKQGERNTKAKRK
jgi:hypothetical protein